MNKYYLLPLFLLSFILLGCGGKTKADENKPMSEVKQEAESFSMKDLKKTVSNYEQAIEGKMQEMSKLQDKLKGFSFSEMMGDEAKAIKSEVDKVNTSMKNLKERLQVYMDKLLVHQKHLSNK